MTNYEHFEFSISDPDETDLILVSVTDKRTNFTVRTALPNHGKQTASIMAFAGARYSRSDLSAHGLFKEIKESGKNANEKLATIFKNYGHASVADMAMLFLYIENVPDLYAVKFLYETSIGGGQHRSTRYQDFSTSAVVELSDYVNKSEIDKKKYDAANKAFTELQEKGLSYYRKYVEVLTPKYTEVYGVDPDDKRQTGALTARVFDSARYFLPSGAALKTSFAWITSAREWARLISLFKSAKDKRLNYLGELIEVVFAPDADFAKEIGYVPEAPDLIRHTGSDETTSNNLSSLKSYLEEKFNFSKIAKLEDNFGFHPLHAKLIDEKVSGGLKAIMQNIMTLYPVIEEDWLIDWLKKLPESEKKAIGDIALQNFNHHKQMGNAFRVNTHSYLLTMSVSEMRDLNRHRAWGRFVPMLATETDYASLIRTGYTLPAYLSDNPTLSKEREDFENDLKDYYNDLESFVSLMKKEDWIPGEIVLELLPFGHVSKMWMHGSPKEISYMTKLRVRPGGHINYRQIVYDMAEVTSQADPFLNNIKIDQRPDASSREEFLDRS